jgi:hypothetical protein
MQPSFLTLQLYPFRRAPARRALTRPLRKRQVPLAILLPASVVNPKNLDKTAQLMLFFTYGHRN